MPQVVNYKETITIVGNPPANFDGGVSPRPTPIDLRWPEGTAAQQANRIGQAGGTLAAAATVTIDLTALAGPGGANVGLAEVRMLRVETTGRLKLEPGAVDGWTGLGAAFEIDIPPGTLQLTTSGADGEIAVGASSKTILITAGAAGATYRVIAIGASA